MSGQCWQRKNIITVLTEKSRSVSKIQEQREAENAVQFDFLAPL